MPPRFSRALTEKIIFPERPASQPRTSPCEDRCPAGNPIQRVQSLIKDQRIEEAAEYLRARNPFPGITGRVCDHPCEQACNRNEYDQGLAIRSLERFAADQAESARVRKPEKRERSGRRIAVIGSGPAGLTCAYFSALLGHDVTVFESAPVLGGLPRTAIPDFRLPKYVVDREVGLVLDAGVKARTNTSVGKDISFGAIRADFDAAVIAVGTWKERRLAVPGFEAALPAVAFLRQVNLGIAQPIGRRVVIMGGGGVAFDAAFTVKRLGASEVHVVCVEGPDGMCATADDLRQAAVEGITIHNSRMITAVLTEGGRATGVESFEVSSFCFDERGCLSVEPAGGARTTIAGDTVLAAVGVEADLGFHDGPAGFDLTPRGTLAVDASTFATSVPGVFAAGDIATGPSTVARAIGSGRRAAMGVHAYLSGESAAWQGRVSISENGSVLVGEPADVPAPHVVKLGEIMNLDYHEKKPRVVPGDGAAAGSEEIDRGLPKEGAVAEAGRCFHCGHCTSCGTCVEDCPGFVLAMTPEGPQVLYGDECWHCGCCRIACPSGAVLYEFPLNMLV